MFLLLLPSFCFADAFPHLDVAALAPALPAGVALSPADLLQHLRGLQFPAFRLGAFPGLRLPRLPGRLTVPSPGEAQEGRGAGPEPAKQEEVHRQLLPILPIKKEKKKKRL